jgi:glucose/arabinose dehydrogenase
MTLVPARCSLWVGALCAIGCSAGEPARDASALDATAPDATLDATTDASMDASADVSADRGAVTEDVATADVALGEPFCASGTDVAGLRPPPGFCVRKYADVPHPRTMVFAPNGDLFVGSPGETYVTSTGPGTSGVVVLSDDDGDGVAARQDFLTGVADLHGVAIGGGFLWYTTVASVWRTPYRDGQRAETAGMREDLRLPTSYRGQRSTHPLARSLMGAMYSSSAVSPMCGPATGEIFRVSQGAATTIARGFRNPMYIRCHFAHELCAATELGDDGSVMGIEKLLLLSSETNYGYPECDARGATARCGGSCASVTVEDIRFPLNDTPFGFDWERGLWPEPYRHGLFVALHGSFYTPDSYRNAGLVYVSTDPATGRPRGTAPIRFLEGLGVARGLGMANTVATQRPADVAFASDGRLFFSVDQGNAVYWLAPTTLRRPLRAR